MKSKKPVFEIGCTDTAVFAKSLLAVMPKSHCECGNGIMCNGTFGWTREVLCMRGYAVKKSIANLKDQGVTCDCTALALATVEADMAVFDEYDGEPIDSVTIH